MKKFMIFGLTLILGLSLMACSKVIKTTATTNEATTQSTTILNTTTTTSNTTTNEPTNTTSSTTKQTTANVTSSTTNTTNSTTTEENIISIKDAISSLNNIHTVKGIVTSIEGNSLTIEDDTAAVYVFFGSKSSGFVLGDLVKIRAKFINYNGLIEAKDITQYTKISSNNSLPEIKEITDLSDATLAESLSKRVSINNVKLVKVINQISSNRDSFITISLAEVNREIKVSKYLDSKTKAAIMNKISTLDINDTFAVNGITVSAYNEYQFSITDVNQLVIAKVPSILGEIFIPEKITTYKDITNKNEDPDYLPSIGSPKILVVPVNFSDARVQFDNNIVQDLEKCFFGESGETGWESVASYYKKSSYGKLTLTGEVTKIVNLSKNTSYYQNTSTVNGNTVKEIDFDILLPEVMNHLDPLYDFRDYDYDNDGVIDGIYFIYNQDVYKRDSHGDISYDADGYIEYNNSDSFWAWVSWYNGTLKYDTKCLYHHMWVGIDFMYFDNYCETDYRQSLEYLRNTETFIHETGHMLGADDYYDYSGGQAGVGLGIGGDDMMDSNYGDHNAVTKMLLGWITPTVITGGEHEITLNGFSKDGSCIVITPNWNEDKNILTEFFVIDYYDYNGLDGDCFLRDCRWFYDDNGDIYYEGFLSNGIRIYYVNADTSKENGGDYYNGTYFSYDNSDEDYAFITLVDAYLSKNTGDFLESSYTCDSSSLFQKGETFTPNTSSKGYNSKNWFFTVTVLEILEETAKIKISFN